MAKKAFIVGFLLLLTWLCYSDCHHFNFKLNDVYDELVNETLTDAILMEVEIQKLIDILTGSTTSHETTVRVAPIAILAGMAIFSGTVAAVSLGYTIWRQEKNANAAEAAQIKNDENWKKLQATNEILISAVANITNAIESATHQILAKLDELIRIMKEKEFNEQVRFPFAKLIDSFTTLVHTMSSTAAAEFDRVCKANPPADLISVFQVITAQMYAEKQSFYDEGYDLIVQMEDAYEHQFAMLFPACQIVSNGPPTDKILQEYHDIVLDLLQRFADARNKSNQNRNQIVFTPEFVDSLNIEIDKDAYAKYFTSITTKLASLTDPESGHELKYFVAQSTSTIDSLRYYYQKITKSYDIKFEKRGLTFLIIGIPAPDDSPSCDFQHQDPAALEEEYCSGTLSSFMDKYCTFSLAFQHLISPGIYNTRFDLYYKEGIHASCKDGNQWHVYYL